MTKFTTLSGEFFVGMKLSDCKTDAQKKEFKRIDKLDGKIQQILSGEDVCRQRDYENGKRFMFGNGVIGTAGVALSVIPETAGTSTLYAAGAAAIGFGFNLWNTFTDINTDNYKKEHGIEY